MLPSGADEMVVDLMPGGPDGETVNPMKRFDDGWETSYVSDYQREERENRGVEEGGGKVVRDKGQESVPKDFNVAPWDKIW